MFQLASLVILFLTTTTSQAQAYIDPGTGSILLQGLIAALAAASATLGLFWHRIKSFFRSGSSPSEPPEESAEDRR